MTDRRSQLRTVQVALNRAHMTVTADYDDTLAGVLDAIDQALVETLDARAKLAPVITVSGHIGASQQWLDSLPSHPNPTDLTDAWTAAQPPDRMEP